MTFKEFLINEHGGGGGGHVGAGDDFFYNLILYPTDALDGAYAVGHPAETWLLQRRWKKEKEWEKRPMINIDYEDWQKRKITCVESPTMPDTTPGFWKHRTDDRPNLVHIKDANYGILGVGKNSKNTPIFYHTNVPKVDFHLDQLEDPGPSKYPKEAKDKPFGETRWPFVDIGVNDEGPSKYQHNTQSKGEPSKFAKFMKAQVEKRSAKREKKN